MRAVKVAAVVGPILTTINQYDVLLNGNYSPRVIGKIFLTFSCAILCFLVFLDEN